MTEPKVKAAYPSGRLVYDVSSILASSAAKKHLESLAMYVQGEEVYMNVERYDGVVEKEVQFDSVEEATVAAQLRLMEEGVKSVKIRKLDEPSKKKNKARKAKRKSQKLARRKQR